MPTNIELENRVKDVEGYIQSNQGKYERQFKGIHEVLDTHLETMVKTKTNLEGKITAMDYNVHHHSHTTQNEYDQHKSRCTVGIVGIITGGIVLISFFLSIFYSNLKSNQIFAENGYIQDTVKGSQYLAWRKADK
jgi:hypothetical protein